MATLHALGTWLASHVLLDFMLVYGALNVAVALTPLRFQKTRWYGGLLVLAHRLAVLMHSDELGTLKWPFILQAIMVGLPDANVAAAARIHVMAVAAMPPRGTPDAAVPPAPAVPAAPPVPVVPVASPPPPPPDDAA